MEGQLSRDVKPRELTFGVYPGNNLAMAWELAQQGRPPLLDAGECMGGRPQW